jgi:hypothetical protein
VSWSGPLRRDGKPDAGRADVGAIALALALEADLTSFGQVAECGQQFPSIGGRSGLAEQAFNRQAVRMRCDNRQ